MANDHLGVLVLVRDGVPGEPLSCSVPLPLGAWRGRQPLVVCAEDGLETACQARILDAWHDGSARWIRITWLRTSAGPGRLVLRPGVATVACPLALSTSRQHVRLASTGHVWSFAAGDAFPAAEFEAMLLWDEVPVRFDAPTVTHQGPLHATVSMRGATVDGVRFAALVHVYAGWPLLEIELTAHNPDAAKHPGGIWELGDPASIPIRSLGWQFRPASGFDAVRIRATDDEDWRDASSPLRIEQATSGGPNVSSAVHVDRNGRKLEPCREPRHRPVVLARCGPNSFAFGAARFWQEFPKALVIDDRAFRYDLWPAGHALEHELQGGEAKTHRWCIGLSSDAIDPDCLEAGRDGPRVRVEPLVDGWPFIPHDGHAADPDRTGLLSAALEGDTSFFAKREMIDEYGWRHFGDLWADHESAQSEDPDSFVSHYNNQYDAVEGFLAEYLATGQPRWFELGDDLARHVVDIDLYRTDRDRSAYNGGQFWHTAHYVPAGRSTHRTYPTHPGIIGGGPSNEHLYSSGLVLHYLLTGSDASRDAVLQLGRWVIDTDDGSLDKFGWLDRGATGRASASGSADYHGPGRGGGYAITALVDAHRLSGDAVFLRKAEELVHRCIHPEDDIDERRLLDREARWSYTLFLGALGKYLDHREDLGLADEEYAYARDALLAYARWMAEREFPYLDRPEDLEFPTETWAAQELRKTDALYRAAEFAEGAERERLLERARFFHRTAHSQLARFESRTCTRPLAIVLAAGRTHASAQTNGRPRPGDTRTAPPHLSAARRVRAPEAPRRTATDAPGEPRRSRRARRAGLVAALGAPMRRPGHE